MCVMSYIERYKPREDWTPGEILRFQKSGEKPESLEYVERRHKALIDADLEPDRGVEHGLEPLYPDDGTDMSVEQHFERIRQR